MPDVVGFSDYNWSADINIRMSEWVKERSPHVMVVCGGPNITHTPLGYRRFFETHPSVDFNVPYQGEPPFVTLMKSYLDAGKDIARVRETPLDGVLAYDRAGGTVVTGKEDTRLKELDSIPSPYLTGL